MRLWLVRRGTNVYIVTTKSREDAKSSARAFLLGDPDTYAVDPLTNAGDRVRINVGMRLDD